MATLYRFTDENGNSVYLEQMPTARGEIDVIEDGKVVESYDADGYKRAKGFTGDARKHIPKAHAYFDYLEYLRDHKPGQFQKVMKELKKADPQTYMTLQRYRIFRPIFIYRTSHQTGFSMALGQCPCHMFAHER